MLTAKDADTGKAMSEVEIKENIITMIFGGQETTSGLLTWALYLLSQSPEWRARVVEEAEPLIHMPVQEAIPKLIQTRAVAEEALRLYPPIIGIAITAMRNTSIGNQAVARGTMVIISPYVVHRHRLLWRDPDAFDPTRFLPGASAAIRPCTFLPFGVGPRMCIGAGLAVHEATYALATLASQFEFELAPGQNVWPAQKNFTLRPLDGLHMHISRNRGCGRAK
jgi:cytochrome P450